MGPLRRDSSSFLLLHLTPCRIRSSSSVSRSSKLRAYPGRASMGPPPIFAVSTSSVSDLVDIIGEQRPRWGFGGTAVRGRLLRRGFAWGVDKNWSEDARWKETAAGSSRNEWGTGRDCSEYFVPRSVVQMVQPAQYLRASLGGSQSGQRWSNRCCKTTTGKCSFAES